MLKFQKIFAATAAATAGIAGGGTIWSQNYGNNLNNGSRKQFFITPPWIVYAAEVNTTKSTSPNEDKLAALYAEPESSLSSEKSTKDEFPAVAATRSQLEEAIQKCRNEVTPIKDTLIRYTNNTIDFTVRTADGTIERINYIKHQAPKEVQIATIVGSGLVGLILSYRRGFFRKLLYTSAGAGIASLVIYPKKTKSFAKTSAIFIKKYTLVAYHFVVGAQPKDK